MACRSLSSYWLRRACPWYWCLGILLATLLWLVSGYWLLSLLCTMLMHLLLVELTVRSAFMTRTWGEFPVFPAAVLHVKISPDFHLAQTVSPLPRPASHLLDVFRVSIENMGEHTGQFCVTWEVRDSQWGLSLAFSLSRHIGHGNPMKLGLPTVTHRMHSTSLLIATPCPKYPVSLILHYTTYPPLLKTQENGKGSSSLFLLKNLSPFISG